MTHLLLLLCSLLTLLVLKHFFLFCWLTSAHCGLIFGEGLEVSIFVSLYQSRPFPSSPHPAPSSQVLLAFHALHLGADEAGGCHHTAVALQKDKQQLTQKKGIIELLYPAVVQSTPGEPGLLHLIQSVWTQ